jgi:lipoate-protein ligase A
VAFRGGRYIRRVRWHLMETPPWSGAANMAADLAACDQARRTGDAVVRTYAWRTPTVSFGRHQRARGVYDAALIAADGYDVVRRPTGGRALLHHREFTYAIAMPVTGSLRESHAALTALVADALARLGVAAVPAPRTVRAEAPGAAPCFAAPAEGELVVEGHKLVGSAQVREQGALLQHGSVLVDDDQGRLSRYLLVPGRPVPPPQTLRALLGRAPALREFTAAMRDALTARNGSAPHPVTPQWLDPADVRRHVARFRDPDWTWGR